MDRGDPMSVVATRPRINEILREFAARGLIELGYGRITVIDPDALDLFAAKADRRAIVPRMTYAVRLRC